MDAKLAALQREFDALQECSQDLPFWNQALWLQAEPATIQDWILADCWYRSRCLELPQNGASMVPGLDMLNHSDTPTSLYEQEGAGDVVLLSRPNANFVHGQELTISYGEAKSAAEMLFSYGFISRLGPAREMTVPLEPDSDDPLGKAKFRIFNGPPTVKLTCGPDGSTKWRSPFLYLQILNEEDGLDFRLLQGTAGEQELRMFWQGEDITGRSDEMEVLAHGHEMQEIFQLRAVVKLEQMLGEQLFIIECGPSLADLEPLIASNLLRQECATSATALRSAESRLLADALRELEAEASVPPTFSNPYLCKAAQMALPSCISQSALNCTILILIVACLAESEFAEPPMRGGTSRVDGSCPNQA